MNKCKDKNNPKCRCASCVKALENDEYNRPLIRALMTALVNKIKLTRSGYEN